MSFRRRPGTATWGKRVCKVDPEHEIAFVYDRRASIQSKKQRRMTQRISKIETLGPRRAAGGCSWPDPGAGLPRPQITGGRARPVAVRTRACEQ